MSLVNTFAYSGSKIGTFRKCEWQYYLKNYAKWNGWEKRKGDFSYELWRTSRVYQQPAWIGVFVHKYIAQYLKQHFRKGRVNKSKFVDYLKLEFDEFWEISLAGIYGEKKGMVLWEHHFGEPIEIREVWGKILNLFNNFIKTIPGYLKSIDPESILSVDVDDFSQYFTVTLDSGEKVKVFAVPDFAFQNTRTNRIVIWDWKTGSWFNDYSDQLVTYALYFKYFYDEYVLNGQHFSLAEFNLKTNSFTNTKLTKDSFDSCLDKMKSEIGELKSVLVGGDIERNEIDTSKLTKNLDNCDSCVFKNLCDR